MITSTDKYFLTFKKIAEYKKTSTDNVGMFEFWGDYMNHVSNIKCRSTSYSEDIYMVKSLPDDNWLYAENVELMLIDAAYYESINNNYRSKEGHWYYAENKLNWIRKRAYDIFDNYKSNPEHNWYLAEEEYKVIELIAYYNYLGEIPSNPIVNWQEAENKYLNSKNKVNLQDKFEQVRCLAYILSISDSAKNGAEYYWYKAEHQYRHGVIESL